MDDDDFGDFGGFEAADPVVAVEDQPAAQGIEASPSPWAVFAASAPTPGSAVGLQPDLIRAQGPPVSQLLEPPFPEGGAVVAAAAAATPDIHVSCVSTSSHHSQPTPSFDANFSAFGLVPSSGRSLSEQVLEPHFGRHTPPSGVQRVPDGVLDLDLSGRVAREVASPEKSAETSESGISVAEVEAEAEADSVEKAASPSPVGEAPRYDRESAEVAALHIQLTTAEQEKGKIQKELAELLAAHNQAEEGLVVAKQEAQQHRQAYEELQSKHSNQLDEIRQAGHDALAVIVEEYKVLCRMSVKEQQERSQRELTEALREQTEQCSQQMKVQAESFTELLEEERSRFQEKLNAVLEKQAEEQQERLQKALKEERELSEAAIRKSTELETERREKLIQEALEVERKKSTQLLEEEQDKLHKAMGEEREKNLTAVEKTVQEEKIKCQECIKVALAEERHRHEDLVKDMMGRAREDCKTYIQQHRQEDSAVRHRSLTSIDLFLESARKQLQLLLHPDDTGDS